MSTPSQKRTLASALADAHALRDFFAGAYAEWHVAGSVRRRCIAVGDVEHVVVPRIGVTPDPNDLFGASVEVNLMLRRSDELFELNARGGHSDVSKHVYPDGRHRWGERYRGLSFRGFAHELFMADPDSGNLGPTLTIRTGPADFSRRFVTALWSRRLRNHKGRVWRCEPCPCRSGVRHPSGSVPDCGGTGLIPVEAVRVPDERTYFDMAGVPWSEPEDRR